jgi:hypothetical protein
LNTETGRLSVQGQPEIYNKALSQTKQNKKTDRERQKGGKGNIREKNN